MNHKHKRPCQLYAISSTPKLLQAFASTAPRKCCAGAEVRLYCHLSTGTSYYSFITNVCTNRVTNIEFKPSLDIFRPPSFAPEFNSHTLSVVYCIFFYTGTDPTLINTILINMVGSRCVQTDSTCNWWPWAQQSNSSIKIK
jgi:hypothetical protein